MNVASTVLLYVFGLGLAVLSSAVARAGTAASTFVALIGLLLAVAFLVAASLMVGGHP